MGPKRHCHFSRHAAPVDVITGSSDREKLTSKTGKYTAFTDNCLRVTWEFTVSILFEPNTMSSFQFLGSNYGLDLNFI